MLTNQILSILPVSFSVLNIEATFQFITTSDKGKNEKRPVSEK